MKQFMPGWNKKPDWQKAFNEINDYPIIIVSS